MHSIRRALGCALALALHSGLRPVQSRDITGHASLGNFILLEDDDNKLSYRSTVVSIRSNVPVTVQRYYDTMYLEGEQPVRSDEAKVLVTSNCSATTYALDATFGDDSVEVNVQGALGGAKMPFLESSSYSATWNVTNDWCESERVAPPASATREPPVPSSATGRNLVSDSDAVCNVNVEVMLDGCAHGVNVSAPQVRVLDASVENGSSTQNAQNECVWDKTADITFPGPAAMADTGSLRAPVLDYGTFPGCVRAVPGRPFVDSTGATLQASPLILPTAFVGEVEACPEDERGSSCPMGSRRLTDDETSESGEPSLNETEADRNRLLLGREWTKNAIGEHASVASFSAFSIALMTNGAPPDLVKDSLRAALDEVRHAKVSFDIASRLLGREVRPGPLPESAHVFGRDISTLALAVAREGCVDETLSAFEAAAEADLVDAMLTRADGARGTKYDGVDGGDTLAWIRDELRAIATEEGGHAALAWRTVGWACGVDKGACDLVKERVLNADSLEGAYRRRFGPSLDGGRYGVPETVEENWRKVISCVEDPSRVPASLDDEIEGDSLVALVAEEVLRGIVSHS